MRAAHSRSAHLAVWSMFGSIGLFAIVTYGVLAVTVWGLAPRPGSHAHLRPEDLQAPLWMLLLAGIMTMAASLVVLALATWFIRDGEEPAVEPALSRPLELG